MTVRITATTTCAEINVISIQIVDREVLETVLDIMGVRVKRSLNLIKQTAPEWTHEDGTPLKVDPLEAEQLAIKSEALYSKYVVFEFNNEPVRN